VVDAGTTVARIVRVGLRSAVPAAVVGLIALAGLSVDRVYSGHILPLWVAGAAAGAVTVSLALRRAPAWLIAPVSVGTLVAYSLIAIRTTAESALIDGGLGEVALDAARNAIPRLLTALIPVEPQPDTVLGPVVLAWLAALGAAELAGRLRRPAVAMLPPTLLYVGALVLVGPNAGLALWQPLAFATLVATALAASGAGTGAGAGFGAHPGLGGRERTALRLRTATGLGVGLVAVLAVVALVAPVVARSVGRTPTDPRRYVSPPNLDLLDQNPLARISGWGANPEQHLLDVAVLGGSARPASPSPSRPAKASPDESDESDESEESDEDEAAPVDAHDTRLRLAVLTDWDGVTWHVGAEYRTAGRVLPDPAAPPGLTDADAPSDEIGVPRTVVQRITVAELAGRLLPAVSAARRVEGVRVAYDQVSGTLIRPEGLAPGVDYTVTSVNPPVDVNLLPAADVPSGPAVARYLTVGDTVPQDLAKLAEQVASGEGSPYLRALALEAFLADHYRYVSDAPSGHAYPNLRFFLFGPTNGGGRRGTSEQFAAAFATLARLLGMPTRVVVGFSVPAGGGPVTGADGVAWPEVLFGGVGWVPFNPLPEPGSTPQPLEEEYLPKPLPPTEPPQTVEPSQEPPLTQSAAAPTAASAAPASVAVGVVAGGVGGGLLLTVLLVLGLVVLLRAAQRRRRLDRGSAPERVLGAWAEVGDALALAGSPPASHLAAVEVAAHAAAVVAASPGRLHSARPRPPAPPLDDLAAMVNAVGFAGGPARAGGVVADESAAVEAGHRAIGYAAALRARRSWWRRWWWSVSPRPLRSRR
jgi:hypothetical protein